MMVKVKVNVDLYSVFVYIFCREHISKALRCDTHSQGISQFYLHTPRSSANGMNHTCLCLPSRSWYSFTDPGGMEGWVGLGWLVGYIPMATHTVSENCRYNMNELLMSDNKPLVLVHALHQLLVISCPS